MAVYGYARVSTRRCMGEASPLTPVLSRDGRGTASVADLWLTVVWSGTRNASPSRPMMEPIRPSVSPVPPSGLIARTAGRVRPV